MDNTTPDPLNLSERAAELAKAAESAPFFPAGIRDNLTRAAEFATAAAQRIEALSLRVEELTSAQQASTAAEAGFLEKLGELDERTDALETLAAAPKS